MHKVIFAKYSNDRAPQFNIITEIVCDEKGNRKVRKRPFTYSANEHVNRMVTSSEVLRKQYFETSISCAKIEKIENAIEIEWIDGKNFSVYLDELLLHGKKDEWKSAINEYFDNIFIHKRDSFVLTKTFIDVFGDYRFDNNMESVENIDVDILFSNVIFEKKNWVIYDCEWFMEFPIPVKYLIYRCLLYYIGTKNGLGLRDIEIYEEFGIGEKECEIFTQMENHFQRYVEGKHIPMWRVYEKIHGEIVNVCELQNREVRKKMCQVFYDLGDGFSEENSKLFTPAIDKDGIYKVCISVPEGSKAIRFDPSNVPCLMGLKKIINEERVKLNYITNGYSTNENEFLFLHCDPQIVVEEKLTDTITFEYILKFAGERDIAVIERAGVMLGSLFEERDILKKELQAREKNIQEQGKQIQIQESQIQDQKRKLEENKTTIQNYEMRYTSQVNQYKKAETELKEIKEQYNQIINSTCWKITMPLRFLIKKIKGSTKCRETARR